VSAGANFFSDSTLFTADVYQSDQNGHTNHYSAVDDFSLTNNSNHSTWSYLI